MMLFAVPAVAQQAPRAGFYELRSDTATDIAVVLSAGSAWLGSELTKGWWVGSECRWCDRKADGSEGLNSMDAGVRSSLRWSDTKTADVASYVVAYAALPAATVGLSAAASFRDGGQWSTVATDALLVAQAAAVAGVLNQFVKFAALRERPFVHVLPPDEKSRTSSPTDNNLSFFSGHTTWAFAVAVAGGTVASMRGYRYSPLVWGVGLPMAGLTGYLRIAADRHYFSDVVVGMLVGSAVGMAVPLLFHSRIDPDVSLGIASAPNGIGLQCSGVF